MFRRCFPVFLLTLWMALGAGSAGVAAEEGRPDPVEAAQREVTQGALRIVGKDGSIVQCPLKHTAVKADVSGFIARVNVTQTFQNPTKEKIEAVYVFPLPNEAAVDSMTMVVGKRRIEGRIKRRAEARRIYQQALSQGQTAALLEQERPNIFTQSVANIDPGQQVRIEISYVDVLKYDMGEYEFHFPMVIGPRFIPGAPISSPVATPPELQGKVAPPVADTDRVPDASRISPPVLKPKVRNGHDISLTLSIDAGVPVQNLEVANHEAKVRRDGDRKAVVKLSPADSVPNKDFVVRYAVAGNKPQMAVLAHAGRPSRDAARLGNGYFMMMIQPQEDERLKKSPPREMVFLVDVSGSMRGAKTAMTRQMMQQMLGLCREKDTVQVITFAGQAHKLFDAPLPVNEGSIKRALNFTEGMRGRGGTHMLEGVKLAIDAPIDKDRIRIIVMLTDGFIGNEAEIIQHVGKNCGDQIRFWTVGVGQSPNMFLIDGVAKQGGGMGKRLGLNDGAEPLSHEIMTRIQRAQLAKVKIDWGGLQVKQTYPARIPELWAGRPVIVFGRYRDGGRHEITVSGNVEGEPVSWPLAVELPDKQPDHDVLAKVWARRKIEDLMHQTYYQGSPAVEEEVTALALDYKLMSQYTSFVAVDEKDADKLKPAARPPRRMLVPVPLPEGAEWHGFFGGDGKGKERDVSGMVRFSAPALRAPLPTGATRGRGWGAHVPLYNQLAAKSPADGGFYYHPSSTRGLGLLGRNNNRAGLRVKRQMTRGGSQPLQSLMLLTDSEERTRDQSISNFAAFRVAGQTHSASAQKALQEAKRLAQDPQNAQSRERASLIQAFFFDQAAANLGLSGGQVAAESLQLITKLNQAQTEAWIKQTPSLERRLDLVVRDQSIDEALQQVAQATGLMTSLIPGSVEDATKLPGAETRISYLDLRNATVAQALDWILRPARLTWTLQDGKILAGSERRMSGLSAWVYDVSAIVFPSPSEMQRLEPQAKATAGKKACDELLALVLLQLKADGKSVGWFAPGQLLVIGSQQLHQQADALFARLTHGKSKLPGEAGKLQTVTMQRAQQNAVSQRKQSAARHRVALASRHTTFGWQLLAAAAGGKVDEEALVEMGIAWRDNATDELLAGPGQALVMRSWWIVVESSRALPDDPKLATLATLAANRCQPLLAAARQRAQEKTSGVVDFAAALYGSLAAGESGAQALRPLLSAGDEGASPVKPLKLIATALLGNRGELDNQALIKLVSSGGVQGEDMTLLAGLACHRVGGEVWQTFRAESRDILGRQPLSGHTIVMIDRLSEGRLPISQ